MNNLVSGVHNKHTPVWPRPDRLTDRQTQRPAGTAVWSSGAIILSGYWRVMKNSWFLSAPERHWFVMAGVPVTVSLERARNSFHVRAASCRCPVPVRSALLSTTLPACNETGRRRCTGRRPPAGRRRTRRFGRRADESRSAKRRRHRNGLQHCVELHEYFSDVLKLSAAAAWSQRSRWRTYLLQTLHTIRRCVWRLASLLLHIQWQSATCFTPAKLPT